MQRFCSGGTGLGFSEALINNFLKPFISVDDGSILSPSRVMLEKNWFIGQCIYSCSKQPNGDEVLFSEYGNNGKNFFRQSLLVVFHFTEIVAESYRDSCATNKRSA